MKYLTWKCLLIALFFGFYLWYSSWRGGTVFATTKAGNVTLRIRQIPMNGPGLNSEYAYRCEIWRKGVLFKSTTQIADSFIANRDRCRIEVISPTRAIFHLDGYQIICNRFDIADDTPTDTEWRREPR